MEVNERDLYVFMIMAGLWLKDRAPPVVRQALKISKECGIYTSAALFERALERLIEAKWLAPVEYGRGMRRYIPTPRGLLHSHMTISLRIDRDENMAKYLNCIAKHVDILHVAKVSHVLVGLYVHMPFLSLHKRPIIGLPAEARDRLRAVIQVLEENYPIDVQTAEWLLQIAPVLECNFEFYALYTAFQLVASERDCHAELAHAVKSMIEAMAKLARYCATCKGIQPFDTIASQFELLLQQKFTQFTT